MAATKETILASAKALTRHAIDVPAWGGEIFIRDLSGIDRGLMTQAWDRFRQNTNGSESDWAGYEAFVCAWCVVDSTGKRMFSDAEVMALSQTPSKIIEAVSNFAARINGLGRYAEEILPKSSEGSPSVECGSGSPWPGDVPSTRPSSDVPALNSANG